MNFIRKFIASIDEAKMKQMYGDKPGQYRPMTKKEVRKDVLKHSPNATERDIQCEIEFEANIWDINDLEY